ncbi:MULTISPECIES: CoA transferase [Bradyrhizobium]|uniref:CoA transferase n=1 Tax=Bradyrhizobium TaxID=374 RepID=UPI0009B75B6B|nr:CoA transferase [Bradyrhizobium japonicum]MCS3534364.1 crotonobetainyl-CoA:carnitine CoA-transferase CaiB-like acyl-CoA transferase [Bradyrhizobium japonicum]MCS3989540.1 crotonobetainyl-CoA:carnitine CoA-transferase CaiB-like acyl-CoA transferase [Bradyrhizobium japonicum]MCS4015644.1 crotonobetainyl-CoA:carnitine CoA-transferase CaiB-like acyl-CoA transferase [Bradyrhizobium japonicum]MCS4202740.1 crotonobetainyl-CoA:carnitine CoA-transferase CaiB-like acyl-CoA transferase [Bradyrhizobium 
MSVAAQWALDGLLSSLGMSRGSGALSFVGDDPIVPSRFRPAAACAAAIAAEACGISAIWKMRSGRDQDIRVDLRHAAVPGLRTSLHIHQNGHHLDLGRPVSERPNFFRTRDGRRMYLLRASAYHTNLIALLDLLKCANTTDAISEATSSWSSDDLEDALAERKVIGVMARTREEWLSHPQGSWLSSRPVVHVQKIAESPARPFTPAERPLSDIRVLDMAHLLAGPVSARVLAEQGADVLRVSAPLKQDDFRYVIDTSFGKRSAFIDLDRTGDMETLKKLITRADVFVQSFRPGSLAKRGLSPEEMAVARPGIIYVTISAYGMGGPWMKRGGLEQVGQAVSGLAIAEGSSEVPVLAPTFTLNDYLAAYLGSAGVVAALVRRAKEGGSYRVEVSLTGCSMWLQELGMLPQNLWRSEGDRSTLPVPPMDSYFETSGAFGNLTHPKPLVEFSETAAYWNCGPSPLGSSIPAWLDASQ